MTRSLLCCAFLAAGISSAAAAQENELVILMPANPLNVVGVSMDGSGNRLEIFQEHFGGGAANAIVGSITGENNGGPEGSTFSAGHLLRTGLTPGTLSQSGFGNTIRFAVTGSENLFAFSQQGTGNTITASIQGVGNQAAVSQTGNNNFASFSQNGIGNSVSIMQKSW